MKALCIAFVLVLVMLSVVAWSGNLNFEGGFRNYVHDDPLNALPWITITTILANDWHMTDTLVPVAYVFSDVYPCDNVADGGVHGGNWSHRISCYQEGGLRQALPTTPGKRYIVSAWLRNEHWWVQTNGDWAATQGVSLGLGTRLEGTVTTTNWNDSHLPNVDDRQRLPVPNPQTPPGIWVRGCSLPYVATSATTEFVASGWLGTFYIDDVEIREWPLEPPASPYYKIYSQTSELAGGGSLYFTGGVFDGKVYTGQISQCAQLWGDEQVVVPEWSYDYWDGTEWIPTPTTSQPSARVSMTQPAMPTGTSWPNPVAKCSIPLGGWIYMAGGGTAMFRTASWWNGTSQSPITQVNTPSGEIVDSICTDGTYIFATTWSLATAWDLYYDDNLDPPIHAYWPSPERFNKIYKYAVDHSTGTLTNVSGWPKTIAGTTAFTGISYYQGKIYAVDSTPLGGIYEIDAATGNANKLADFIYQNDKSDDTQVVRYGNQLFITCAAPRCNRLYTYTLNGSVWSATSSIEVTDDSGWPLDVYGVAVKGDGTTAQYAWVTAEGGTMHFYGLTDPWAGSATDLGALALKSGHRVYATDAVVTTIGADGFWIENTDRTTAAHVIYSGAPPVLGHLVKVKGIAGKTPGGEKTLTADLTGVEDTGVAADPEVTPLHMTNKTMGALGASGLATDGLLVSVSGKVSYCDLNTFAFYIDDGSGVASDLPGVLGVKVLKADGTTFEAVSNYMNLVLPGLPCVAKVTGVVRIGKLPDGTITRQIDARSDDDLLITAL